jgi:tetratricopeptide (TPR) repeat protein
MITDPTPHLAQNSSAFRCAAATAIFLGAILNASAGLACCPNVTGNPHDPNSYVLPPAAPPPGGSADLKTCDKGLVYDVKKKKCVVKRSGVESDEDLTDLRICFPGQMWDIEHEKCLQRRSGILPDFELTDYAFTLAGAERYQEAIDVLDLLDNPNTPEALNARGYATRKLGRTDGGIAYYLKSVALDPSYPQVREYLGEAYVIQGKFDLAKEQLATIEKLCGSKDCKYYHDLAEALEQAHAL